MNPALEPPRKGLTGAIIPALAAAALAGLGAMVMVGNQRQSLVAEGAPPGCMIGDLESVGGPFSLIDENGHSVTQADFSRAPAIVYFGFTHCPDVCPTTLYALGAALSETGGRDVQTIFITLDPERDTPERVGAYVASSGFPEGLAGLTGDVESVRAAANAFGVAYRKAPYSDRPDDYSIDHTSLIYVMDEGWRTRAQMTTIGATPEALAACVSAGLAQ